jgi:uncharacterized protein YbjT (DUF2867 family)
MKHVLVTGATGNVGRQVVSQLQSTNCRIRALTRNPDEAYLPPLVEVVRGDLTDAETLDSCLAGIDTVFLVWTAPAASAPAVVSRIARRAERIVLLTSPHKTPHPFFQQPNPLRKLFEEIEHLIESSGLGWTFLRPGMFADNALAWWGPQIRAGNVVRWPYAAAPTAPIDVRDIAAVAVRTLLDAGHDGAEYVLTGPESLTQREQVRTIGEVIGRPVRFEELTPDEARRQLGFPESAMTMLLDAWAAALGQPAFMSSAAAELTGKRARTFREWVTDHAVEFGTGSPLQT